ncbi:proton-conducting transporter membrane subunit [uncultured Fluviicola sp.]|uniref:proton-conducting transporter transmembrane domain-containing protein n=1 Tax=uncultured Fluviicola sp. TaxID=463303 RepID=UPI0025FCFFEE|nr:proton-conducting transporter membrane subunit [uncultured Fluviicola sp.]
MANSFLLLPFLIIPALQVLGALIPRFHHRVHQLNFLNLMLSLYGIILLTSIPSMSLDIFTFEGLGISVRIDRLNVVLLTMISIIGLVVSRFSNSYLDGNPRKSYFIATISGIIGSVQLFVLSGNIALLFLSWVATSLFLQKLLHFHSEREKARLAARKKFILARLGDFTLLCSLSMLFYTFKTGDLNTIFKQLQETGTASGTLTAAAIFLAATAILKSAQMPFHGWLIEVTESPTPVSALLHAGLINSGPYLIIRFAALIQVSESTQLVLFTVGIITALFGSFVFIYQPAVKNSLAYSSVAHMGFTILLCGIGAYSAALLHLTAHSFYKAHAFLSSGSEVERMTDPFSQTPKKNHLAGAFGFIISFILGMSIGYLIETYLIPIPFVFSVLYILVCTAISSMISKSLTAGNLPGAWLRITSLGILSLVSLVGFELLFHQLVSSQISELSNPSGVIRYAAIGMLTIFSILIVSRTFISSYFLQMLRYKLSVHLMNGLYLNLLINNLMGAHKK